METTKIEKIPHGVVLRDSKNAVFITRRDMKELRTCFRHGEFKVLGDTFITVESPYDHSITFMDIFSDEYVTLKHDEVMELLK